MSYLFSILTLVRGPSDACLSQVAAFKHARSITVIPGTLIKTNEPVALLASLVDDSWKIWGHLFGNNLVENNQITREGFRAFDSLEHDRLRIVLSPKCFKESSVGYVFLRYGQGALLSINPQVYKVTSL